MEARVRVTCKGYDYVEVYGETKEEIRKKVKELNSNDIHDLLGGDFNPNDLEWKPGKIEFD